MRHRAYILFAYIERSIIFSTMTSIIINFVDFVLDMLNFEGCVNPHFRDNGMGKIGTTGFVLGFVGGVHIGVAILASIVINQFPEVSYVWTVWQRWSIYMGLLCTFHFLEFFITAVRQSNSLSYNSYIVNHGRSYTVAAAFSWLEFWIEAYFFGKWKIISVISWIGVFLVLLGQIIRSIAMWTCGENFSHIIADEKTTGHVLIQHGIYAVLRHPSYFGWFYWSIGTQLILCNPLSTVLYTGAAWYFFASRIPYEEYTLHEFFGERYLKYVNASYIGIPGIKAFVPHDIDTTVTDEDISSGTTEMSNASSYEVVAEYAEGQTQQPEHQPEHKKNN